MKWKPKQAPANETGEALALGTREDKTSDKIVPRFEGQVNYPTFRSPTCVAQQPNAVRRLLNLLSEVSDPPVLLSNGKPAPQAKQLIVSDPPMLLGNGASWSSKTRGNRCFGPTYVAQQPGKAGSHPWIGPLRNQRRPGKELE